MNVQLMKGMKGIIELDCQRTNLTEKTIEDYKDVKNKNKKGKTKYGKRRMKFNEPNIA